MKVQLLPDIVINQISAGEVVERPASVVRELVDNAIDAGASDILVEIEEGGQQLIRVCDNGSGMSRADAELAILRHATSKIRSAEDLENIATMGFRGEALPSIAAVSRLRMLTRTAQEEMGTELVIEGGVVRSVGPSPSALGTTIEVHSLFWNTPARKKFLKSDKTEVTRIKTWLSQSSLAHPEVRYRLLVDGKEALNFPKVADEQRRAHALFRGALVPFESQTGSHSVRGAVGHPSAAQFDSSAFVILVNGRLVSDRMILRAVKDGFDSTLKEREFPVGFIHIQIPSAELDVNVHPQKSEVRFRDGGRVFALVRETVLRAVRSFSSPMRPSGPEAPLPGYRSITEPMPSRETNEVPQHVYRASGFGAPAPQTKLAFQSAAGTQAHPAICSGAEAHSESKKTPSEPRFSELRYVGQVLSCYLVCEWQEALYVVDMHAAHERYNYNVIRQRLRDKQADSQQLLVPMVVELSELGVEHCMNLLPQFQTVGFEWEALGSTALVVRAVPSFFKDAHVVSVLRDIAALAASELTPASFEQEVDHIAARLACHASIRSGRELEKEEVYALFAAMDSSEFSAACPHGRPVIVRFAREDIEAWFGRDC